MLTYTLKKERGRSLYAALYAHIRADIEAGTLPAGTRLPSKRALAANLGVSVMTVVSAYEQLIAEGYAVAKERSGIFVCEIGVPPHSPLAVSAPPTTEKEPPLLDLSGGGGEDMPFPFTVWAKTVRTVMAERGEAILKPVDFRGAPELRQAIAVHLYQSRGLTLSPEQILVGAGNEALYGMLVQLLGRGRVYAVEDPAYRKITAVYAANDVDVRHIPLDAEGLSVRALKNSDAEIVHISPAHHYPTGIVMPIARRNALLDWAYAEENRMILEDDYDSALRHTGKPVPPLFSLDRRQRVIYFSTFSQTIAPSLRIAYACLPPRLLPVLREKLGFYACAVPTLEQYALAEFITSGAYEKHINRLRKRFRDKRSAIFAAIADSALHGSCEILEEAAGTHLLLRLRTKRTDAALKAAARERGLSVRFLSDYQETPRDTACLILNYACLALEKLPAALNALAEILV